MGGVEKHQFLIVAQRPEQVQVTCTLGWAGIPGMEGEWRRMVIFCSSTASFQQVCVPCAPSSPSAAAW